MRIFSAPTSLGPVFITLMWFVLPQCNLMYGWKLYSYHTLLHAAKTIVSLQLGIFNYEEVCDVIIRHIIQYGWIYDTDDRPLLQVLHYNPVLGAFVIGSCIIFMTFVVLNLFISVILVAFSEEQLHHKVRAFTCWFKNKHTSNYNKLF